MIISIQGLTDATIVLNSLKRSLVGKTTLSNIAITDDEQMREIISLKNAGLLIDSQSLEAKTQKMKEIKINPIIENGNNSIENESNNTSVKKFIKAIARKEEVTDNSEVTVMTLNGPRSGKMARNMAGDMPETDATRASIEALKRLEEEDYENEEAIEVDESNLPMNERMGLEATVGTGKEAAKVNMQNSILPESEISAKARAKGKNIKFINPVDDNSDKDPFIDTEINNKISTNVKDAFIDLDNNPDTEDISGDKTGEY
jgi:hypothetical protein